MLAIAEYQFTLHDDYGDDGEEEAAEGDEFVPLEETSVSSLWRNVRATRVVEKQEKGMEEGAGGGVQRKASKGAKVSGKPSLTDAQMKVSNLVAKEVVKHIGSFTQRISQCPEQLLVELTSSAAAPPHNITYLKTSTSPPILMTADSIDTTTVGGSGEPVLFSCAGQLWNSLLQLFADVPSSTAATVASADNNSSTKVKQSTPPSRDARTRRPGSASVIDYDDEDVDEEDYDGGASATAEPAAPAAGMLIDRLPEERVAQVLDVVAKLLAQGCRECISLLKMAHHLRSTVNFIAKAIRRSNAGQGGKICFSDSDDEEERHERRRYRGSACDDDDDDDDASHDNSDSYDTWETEQITRLGSNIINTSSTSSSSSPPVRCAVLIGLLAHVPACLVVNLRAWLERRTCSALPSRPSAACVAVMKRVHSVHSALESLQSNVFGVLKELDQPYPQEVTNKCCTGNLYALVA